MLRLLVTTLSGYIQNSRRINPALYRGLLSFQKSPYMRAEIDCQEGQPCGKRFSALRRQDKLGEVVCFVTLAALLLIATVCVEAKEREYDFQIPAMKADAALSLLAQQSNTPLLFPQALVRNVKTNRVAGRFTVREALDILLANTGITGELSITGVLTVKPLGPGKLTAEEKNMKLEKARFASLTVFLASFFGASAEVASQQEPDIEGEKAIIEEVTVKGFRGALKDALDVKRNSSQVVEAISQEDIGALPDVTIADSIGYLPGLFATRDRGNASFISARGIGPRLSLSILDGRELPTAEPDRSVRYEQYPSELIGGIQVYKTQNASLVEGGIGAVISLSIIDPLEHGERMGTLKASGLYYEDADDFPLASAHGARFSGTYVDQFMDDKVGVVVGYSYQDQPSVLGHYDHWGFSGSSGDANGDGSPDEGFWGSGPTIISGDVQRQSGLAKVQWAPVDNFVMTANAYYADVNWKEFEAGSWNGDWSNSGGYQDAAFSNAVVEGGRVTAGTIDGAGLWMTQFSARWLQENKIASTGINAKWNTDDGWEIVADASFSKAKRNNVWRAIPLNYSNSERPLTVNFDTRVTSPPQISYNQSVTNLSDFSIGNLIVADNGYLGDTIIATKFDVTKDLDFDVVSAIKVGARYSDRNKYYRERNWNQAPLSTDTSTIPTALVSNFDIPGAPPAILIDFDDGVDALYGGTDDASPYPIDHLQSFDVSEEIMAAYAMAELDTAWGDIPVNGNLGVRIVHTTQEATGFEQVSGTFQEATDGLSYTEVLPSMNLNFAVNDASMVRFGAGRAMSRAPLDEMRIARSRSVPIPGQPTNVSGGNPRLKPFLANQVDLTYEWYFSEEGLAAINLYYKDLESYVVITEARTTVDGRDALLLGSTNGSGGNIRGVELSFQSPFTFLPAPLNDFGLFATYSHANTNIREVNGELLNGLAKHNVATQLWYNRGQFEARLGYTYRSEGTQQLNWSPGSLALLKSAGYLDLTVSYDITDNLEIRGNAANLTDEASDHTVQPIDGIDYFGRFRPSGRRFELGVTYQF